MTQTRFSAQGGPCENYTDAIRRLVSWHKLELCKLGLLLTFSLHSAVFHPLSTWFQVLKSLRILKICQLINIYHWNRVGTRYLLRGLSFTALGVQSFQLSVSQITCLGSLIRADSFRFILNWIFLYICIFTVNILKRGLHWRIVITLHHMCRCIMYTHKKVEKNKNPVHLCEFT